MEELIEQKLGNLQLFMDVINRSSNINQEQEISIEKYTFAINETINSLINEINNLKQCNIYLFDIVKDLVESKKERS